MVSDSCNGSYNPLELAGYTSDISSSVKGSFTGDVSELVIEYTAFGGSDAVRTLGNNDADKNEMLDAACDGVSFFTVTATTTSGTCNMVVAAPCTDSEICSSARRLHDESDESFKDETDADDEEDVEDVPYCLSEDFPCEGEDENMVYVCHYIPRKGYQTFCVHEADSVILGFYPNDYCGPCEGGYGNVGK